MCARAGGASSGKATLNVNELVAVSNRLPRARATQLFRDDMWIPSLGVDDDGEEASAPRVGRLEALSRSVDVGIQRFFGALGALCARSPKRVLAVATVCVLLCGTGLANFSLNTDDDTLYLPEDAVSVERSKWISKTFVRPKTDKSRTLYVFATGSAHKNVLRDRGGVRALFEIHEKTVKAGDGDGAIEGCAARNDYGNPIWEGPLAYWNYSRGDFEADADWRRTLARKRTEDRYGVTQRNGAKIVPQIASLERLVGGVERTGDEITGARAFQVRYKLHGDCPDSVSRAADAAIEKLSPARNELDCYVRSHTSYRDAVYDAIWHDLLLVVASLALLVVFATVCFARGRARTRSLVGVAALASVLLALVAAFGLWMACGGYFHSLMAAAIFMTLGLGVDDAFVIVGAVDARDGDDDDDDLDVNAAAGAALADGLAQAGASILVTSTTDAAAFAACALTSRIPALTSFCGVAALCVGCDFLLQVTFFPALFTFVLRAEIAAKRTANPFGDGDARFEAAPPGPSRTRRLARRIASRSCRCATFAILAVLVGLGIVGGNRLEMEYETQWMAPDDSSARRAYAVEDEYFLSSNTWFVDCYSRHGTPDALYEHLGAYREAVDALGGLRYNVQTKSWLPDLDAYLERTNGTGTGTNEADFDAAIVDYRATAANHYGREDLAFRNDRGGAAIPGTEETAAACSTLSFLGGKNATDRACATKVPMAWSKVSAKSTQMERLDRAQELLDRAPKALGLFVQRSPVLEALAMTWPQTKKSVLYVALTVFACALLLLGRLSAALLMLAVMSLIDVILIGALYWIGEYCNMITAVILTLAIGLAVDFSAHVAHAYFHEPTVEDALARMLPPILKGGVSTLLAVLPMAASQSYVIRLFFTMSLMIVAVGLFVGLCVVPAVLQTADDFAAYRRSRAGGAPGGDDAAVVEAPYHRLDDEDEDREARRNSRLRVMELCDTG